MVISGCGAAVAGSQPQDLQMASAPAPAPSTRDPASSAAATDASAVEAITVRIAEALNSLAAETPTPDAEALRVAFESAGADGGLVEVSIDTTPTGLEVDAMTGAVPVGEWCIFGHVRDGVATVTQLPVLAEGRCFIGDQR